MLEILMHENSNIFRDYNLWEPSKDFHEKDFEL